MKLPTNVTQLKQFLGLCAYFCDYVPNMSDQTFLLSQLLKKGVTFSGPKTMNGAFKA